MNQILKLEKPLKARNRNVLLNLKYFDYKWVEIQKKNQGSFHIKYWG